MRSVITVILVALGLMISSCKKDDPASSTDQFTNKLTLGTGMNASNFTLVGEGTIFTRIGGAATIYYRLESAADFGGAGVSIKIEKQNGSSYTVIGTYAYPNPQSYGHIIMSSFTISDIGSYRATGLLTGSATVVATATFTIQ